MTEPLLLSTTRITTYDGDRVLTGATGFFFERGDQLFLVTSRHVFIDAASKHHPNRIEIELHTDEVDLRAMQVLSLFTYHEGLSLWRQASDGGGEIDVAVLPLPRASLPAGTVLRCFTPAHVQHTQPDVEVGQPLLVVGFPLGFHDTLHHLPVVRQASVASAFGVRFQGQGFFLTDARTHRGASGAPVVMRDAALGATLPWRLLGVHASRMDMGTRDLVLDESLGLNCAWYADILLTLTAPALAAPPAAGTADTNPKA
ncbi:MAG TPA: serine protease [Ideonella sp.]|uniref:S1 family peptidase n=1 Tax=Ideonella sp. TaxID=1929293 RepID=UPI002D1D0667|nr:serine protease [Ideonella sp.]HSI48672.1 serine protease [Ideonella sp.]